MASDLQAVSILVVFIAVAFDLVMRAAWEALDTKIAFGKEPDFKSLQLALVRRLWLFQTLPVGVLTILVAYVLTPRALAIIGRSRLNVVSFDLSLTLFVLITGVLWLIVCALAYTLIRLLRRRRKLIAYFGN